MRNRTPKPGETPALRIHGSGDEPVARPHFRVPAFPAMRSVAVGVCGDSGYDEIGTMAAETLTEQGIAAHTFVDGDLAAFESDLLVLMGSGLRFPQFAELARRYEHRRPKIIVWHLQPLPPTILTRRASELGERLRRGQWEDLLGDWASTMSRVMPARGRMQSLVQRMLSVRLRQEFERLGGREYGDVSATDFCTIFEEADWLIRTFAEPHRWLDAVACSTPTRVAFLRQCGIAAKFVPLGFHPAWGDIGTEERNIDVLFIGSTDSKTRSCLVPEVLRSLRHWGHRTREVNEFPCGDERTALLQRSRVVLNILRFPWEFPGPRLFSGAACGSLVVSNEAVQNEPFQPDVHFVRAPRLRIAESIDWYLGHEEERRRRAARALQSLATELPMTRSVAGLLTAASEPGMYRAAG